VLEQCHRDVFPHDDSFCSSAQEGLILVKSAESAAR
jgi:hypothetical protein